jgi:hypothetical protein
MAFGMGSSISQTRAVLGGLFGNDLTFQRTPKAARMRRPTGSYRAPMSRLVLVEAGFALAYGVAITVATLYGHVSSLPFLILFFHGFVSVAGISALEWIEQRLAPTDVGAPA